MPVRFFRESQFVFKAGCQCRIIQRFPIAMAAQHAGEQAVAAVNDPLAVFSQQIEQRESEADFWPELQVDRSNRLEIIIDR